MKILITGNMGYVGSILVENLHSFFKNDAILYGYDTCYFGHLTLASSFLPEQKLSRQYFGDIRDITLEQLSGVDSVIHLAAISNDPMGNEFENVTEEINYEATIKLAKLSIEAGVKNFVFASSCSMYGQSTDGIPRKESDLTNPLTAYAKSKVKSEDGLKKLGNSSMTITCLRFATACGWSPRIRLDLVLNDFVVSAMTTGKITILSDGTPWRPLIDVNDMAKAIIWAVLRNSKNGGNFLAINTGSNDCNYQVLDIAKSVSKFVTGTTIEINEKALPDKRSYAVDFTLYQKMAPAFLPTISLEKSILIICKRLSNYSNFNSNFRNSNYLRLNALRSHLREKLIDHNLRWL